MQNIVPYEFEIGEESLLSTKHLPLKKGRVKKFTSKFVGPFLMTAKLADGHANRLHFPLESIRIHPNFHISLLKPFTNSSYETQQMNQISEHTKAFSSTVRRCTDGAISLRDVGLQELQADELVHTMNQLQCVVCALRQREGVVLESGVGGGGITIEAEFWKY